MKTFIMFMHIYNTFIEWIFVVFNIYLKKKEVKNQITLEFKKDIIILNEILRQKITFKISLYIKIYKNIVIEYFQFRNYLLTCLH